MGKTTFLIGFGAGYVLGSKAGRERYESIRSAARQVKDSPRVQEAAGAVSAQAADLRQTATTKVAESVKEGVQQATEKVRSSGSDDAGGSQETGMPTNGYRA